MWVWPRLGFEKGPSLLALDELLLLGQQCRRPSDERSDGADNGSFDTSLRRNLLDECGNILVPQAASGRTSCFRGESSTVSLGGAASAPHYSGLDAAASRKLVAALGEVEMSRRLAKLPDGQCFCIPASVELLPPPSSSIMDAARVTSLGSIREALASCVTKGGGSFIVHIPMMSARLCDEFLFGLADQATKEEWSTYVAGVVLGAHLSITVFVPGPPSTPTKQPFAAIILGNGFQLQIQQHGGPMLDLGRFHHKDEASMADMLDRWCKKTLAKVSATWRVVSVVTLAGFMGSGPLSLPFPVAKPTVDSSNRVDRLFVKPSELASASVDVVLVSIGTVELEMEPFELTYGDRHVHALKQLFEQEVADLLGIGAEQVMCGDFLTIGQSRNSKPGQRHLRKSTTLLEFSLLHNGISDLRFPTIDKVLPKRPLPGKVVDFSKSLDLEDVAKVARTLDPALATQNSKGSRRNSVDSRMGLTMNDLSLVIGMATKGKPRGSVANVMPLPQLKSHSSAPNLLTQELMAARGRTLQVEASSKLQPDSLMQRFVAVLSEKNHALRKRPDVFPMLSRTLQGGVNEGAKILAGSNLLRGEVALAEQLKGLFATHRPPAKQRDMSVTCSSFCSDNVDWKSLSDARVALLSTSALKDREQIARVEEFSVLSPSDLLGKLEGQLGVSKVTAACLGALLQWTETDMDAVGRPGQCMKLKHHNIVPRLTVVLHQYKSERTILYSYVSILRNLVGQDVGCIDKIVEVNLVPDLVLLLENFQHDRPIQVVGSCILRRLFLRARETATSGPRTVKLGKDIEMSWTFRATDRVIAAMKQFDDDLALHLDGFVVLAEMAESLLDAGKGKMLVLVVRASMEKHRQSANLCRLGIYTIGKVGSVFLDDYEPFGVRMICDVMELHRSNLELQRASAHTLFSVAKSESALKICRKDGAVTALVLAMLAHTKDLQVQQECSRALEKMCPLAVSKVSKACGDLCSSLPSLFWHNDPVSHSCESMFNTTNMKASGKWTSNMVDSFIGDVLSKTTTKRQEMTRLDLVGGYRRLGLRDCLDALDERWVVPGSPITNSNGEPNKQVTRDIQNLERTGINTTRLFRQGPQEAQLKILVEALCAAATPGGWRVYEAELILLLLGFYAWHNAKDAEVLLRLEVEKAFICWLRGERFANVAAEQQEDSLPVQRAALSAIAMLCKYDHLESAVALIRVGAFEVVLDFASHHDASMRRNALRCLARLLPSVRSLPDANRPLTKIWDLLLARLYDDDVSMRTCVAACCLEVVILGFGESETPSALIVSLMEGLLYGLSQTTPSMGKQPRPAQSACALPILLTFGHMVQDGATILGRDGDERKRKVEQSLLVWLLRWLSVGTCDGATSVDRAAAVSAARTLEVLSKQEVAFGADDMTALLRCGSSDSAPEGLPEPCFATLGRLLERESNVEVLSQLFATKIDGVCGSVRLGTPRVLVMILQRTLLLMRNVPDKASDRVLRSLESVELLLPKHSEKTANLHFLYQEALSLFSSSTGRGSRDNFLPLIHAN